LLAVDEALSRLAALDLQQARVVEMRYFCGMTVEETAQALAISPGPPPAGLVFRYEIDAGVPPVARARCGAKVSTA
jgi:hypothetical protein